MSGGIVRVNKSKDYFVASNEPFNDKRLSWDTRGMMGYLLSKPDGWEVREDDLIAQGPAGKHKIGRMMAEAKQCGYIRRYRYRKPDGTFGWITEVYESPSLNPDFKETPEPTLAELEEAFADFEFETPATTTRLSITGLSMSGSATTGKPGHIVSTERVNTYNDCAANDARQQDHQANGGTSPIKSKPRPRKAQSVPPEQAAMLDMPEVEPKPEKSPPLRKPDALFDAIATAWKTPAALTGKIKQQLTGKATKSQSNFDEPATVEEVQAFVTWYAKRYQGCDLPIAPEKIQHHFYTMRREKSASARKSAPRTRVSNGRLQKYDSDMQNWLDIGPAPTPRIEAYAS